MENRSSGNNRVPSAIRYPPSAICHLPSAICHLPSAICHPPFAICHLPSAIDDAIRRILLRATPASPRKPEEHRHPRRQEHSAS
jgi:hypothetical protein